MGFLSEWQVLQVLSGCPGYERKYGVVCCEMVSEMKLLDARVVYNSEILTMLASRHAPR